MFNLFKKPENVDNNITDLTIESLETQIVSLKSDVEFNRDIVRRLTDSNESALNHIKALTTELINQSNVSKKTKESNDILSKKIEELETQYKKQMDLTIEVYEQKLRFKSQDLAEQQSALEARISNLQKAHELELSLVKADHALKMADLKSTRSNQVAQTLEQNTKEDSVNNTKFITV